MLVDNNNVLNKDMTDTILAAFSEERYGEVTPHSYDGTVNALGWSGAARRS